jgi:2-methylcitrate dehydratase PrpD
VVRVTDTPLIARLATHLQRPVPEYVRTRARLHLLDWMACVAGARRSIVGNAARGAGPDPLERVAYLGNVLEMDDIHRTALLHPGPVVWPSALSAARENLCDFATMLDGAARGYEAMIAVGATFDQYHYANWHPTSTAGGFGGAATACSIFGFDAKRTGWALGNAGSTACGVWHMRHDDVMTKQLHVTHAALEGLWCARAARAGFTGPLAILEGAQGLYAATCRDPKPMVLGPGWRIEEVSFKPWAACRHAHPAIDCALELRAAGKLTAPYALETYADALTFCDRPDPVTETDAKFSLQHAVAVIADGRNATPADFTVEAIAALAPLRAQVTVAEAPEITARYPAHFGARLNGFELVDTLGDPERPVGEADIIDKMHMLAGWGGLPPHEADRAADLALCSNDNGTATADLLEFAGATHALPDSVREDTIRLLADTLAVGAAGATAPGADAILTTAQCFGSGTDARLLGSADRVPAASAAFVNGYRIHCLEWDAVHEPAVVHAMSVVTAALGAAIDRRCLKFGGGYDPETALTALAVGVDIACGLGIAADTALTFFRPATAGVIGAAAAVARIEGASMSHALGLAYSSCAGTMQAHVEGSIALPFQIANAARAAIVAVDLASAGFTAPYDVFDGPFGYFKLIDLGDLSRYTNNLGKVWRIGEISTKPYPSGRASHGVLGALADLTLDPASVERIEAIVPPLVQRLVGRTMPRAMTPAYARLCLPLLASLMIVDRAIDPRRFTEATFFDPAIGALARRVFVTVDDNPDPNALSPQRLIVTLTDGTIIERAIPDTLGSPAAPLSSEQSHAKRTLARALADEVADTRLFDDPLAYFTQPIQGPQ